MRGEARIIEKIANRNRTKAIKNLAGKAGTGDRFKAAIARHKDRAATDFGIGSHSPDDRRHDDLKRFGPDDHFEDTNVCLPH